MTEEQRRKLLKLKSENKKKLYVEKVQKIKNEIYSEIPNFDNYFKFADKDKIAALHDFISKIPALTGTRPDFNLLPFTKALDFEELQTNSNTAWLAFLCGGEGIFDVFIFGKISDILKYYYEWKYLGPYIMFIFEDMNRFIFVDDDCMVVESCLEF